ncbi:MAG: hypothetical protein C0592_13060 [Marinilabiliales bacterium]|nr:MAG: hypothetical protein C0592_13060 [Marinilabiliales bacterium]
MILFSFFWIYVQVIKLAVMSGASRRFNAFCALLGSRTFGTARRLAPDIGRAGAKRMLSQRLYKPHYVVYLPNMGV